MIKNIIFDFGNVIIDINPSATEQKFIDLFTPEGAFMVKSSGILEKYEVGGMQESVFLDLLSGYAPPSVSREDIKGAWNKMLLFIPKERLALLLDLKKQFNTYLLSNTNATHMNWIYDYLADEHDINDWDEKYFHKAYYSHIMEKRKPNSDIFHQVLEEQNLIPEETLFIDDNSENIATARRVGIHGVLHDERILPLHKVINRELSNINGL